MRDDTNTMQELSEALGQLHVRFDEAVVRRNTGAGTLEDCLVLAKELLQLALRAQAWITSHGCSECGSLDTPHTCIVCDSRLCRDHACFPTDNAGTFIDSAALCPTCCDECTV